MAPTRRHVGFLGNWYSRALNGEEQNWDMLAEVAQLPNEVWEDEAELERKILDIQARYAIAATHYSEEIVRGGNGLFHALPVSTIQPELFDTAKDRVASTLAEVRDAIARGNNMLACLNDDLDRLELHLERYGNNPQRLFDTLTRTLRHIIRRQQAGDLVNDLLVEDFALDLEKSANDIRRSDTEVAKSAKSFAAVQWRKVRREDAAKMRDALVQASMEAEPGLAEQIVEDAPSLDPDTIGDEDADETRYREVSRGTRMASVKRKEVVDAADDIVKIARATEASGRWWDTLWDLLPNWLG